VGDPHALQADDLVALAHQSCNDNINAKRYGDTEFNKSFMLFCIDFHLASVL